MTAKEDLRTAIIACAEAIVSADTEGERYQREHLRLSLGTIGQEFVLHTLDGESGDTRTAGESYTRPGYLDCLLEGIAAFVSDTLVAGETIGQYNLIRSKTVGDSGGDGEVYLARDDGVGEDTRLLGVAQNAASSAASVYFKTDGITQAQLVSGLTGGDDPEVGDILYLSSTFGLLTNVAPGGSPVTLGFIVDASSYGTNQQVKMYLNMPQT